MRARNKLLLPSLLLVVSQAADAGISWRTWGVGAFEDARKAMRPIVVNVGHEGCTACRMMEENTFSDPRVIEFINRHFVAIQVDSEMQPDIGERYSDWAWPATAFLQPDGRQVFAIRGSRRPDDFLQLLEQVIERNQKGILKADDLAPYGAPQEVLAGPLLELREQVRRQLDNTFDDERGGWGDAKILEYAEPTLQLFLRGLLYGDDVSTARALKTAYGFLQQLDLVWGGMFYASFDSWDNVVREKRLESQAAALQLFADALQVSGDRAFEAGLQNIHRYLRDWMSSPSGTFYANQKDTGPDLAQDMSIDDYYALDDAGRRGHGLPLVDKAIYTDVNARVISGLVRAFEASGDSRYFDTALKAAQVLIDERQTPAGWLQQFGANEHLKGGARVHGVTVTGLPYLRTQAHFGLAALSLYQAGGDEQWRVRALAIANGLSETLGDERLGGFFSAPASEVDAIVARRKPLEDNAAAARLLYRLAVLNKNPGMKAAAEKTIRAVAAPAIVRREGRITGSLALALELLSAGYVEFSVVGEGAPALALLAAGRAVFEPRKLVHAEAPGRYPARARASMYICNDDQCSLPIVEPAAVATQAHKFLPLVMRSGIAAITSGTTAH
jgi:uncharacterized protein